MSNRFILAPVLSLAAVAALCLAAVGSAAAQGSATGVPIHSHAELAVGGPFQLGAMLLVVGMGAVFLGLMAIYLFLMLLMRSSEKRAPMVAETGGEPGAQRPFVVTAEMASAIALALYMDLRTFDEGTAQEVTIRKITRPFSPWWNAAKTQVMFDKAEMFRRKY